MWIFRNRNNIIIPLYNFDMLKKTKFTLGVLTLLIFNQFALANHIDNSKIQFLHSGTFKEIQKQAYLQNKPIFIDFHAVWCGPCKTVDREIFSNPQVAQYMNANFINYKVDIEKLNGPTLAMVYEVKYLPTVVIVKPNGKIIMKKSSTMSTRTFLNWAKTGKKYFGYVNPNQTKQLNITSVEHTSRVEFLMNESFHDIKDLAKEKNKPIFIDFYASWCGPCQIMDNEVFSNERVAHYMNANFINVKADVSERTGRNLAHKYGVLILPTFIIVTPDGDILSKETQLLGVEEFLSFARNAAIY